MLNKLTVPYHHGDLCHRDGKIYVAVNLGKFNEPAGKADSWVYVYQATDLTFVARYPVPDVVHGAGGMAWHDGRFVVIGGLPPGVDENYAYEYDDQFHLLKRHVPIGIHGGLKSHGGLRPGGVRRPQPGVELLPR